MEFWEEPFVATVSSRYWGSVCCGCFRRSTVLLHCARCSRIHYCSRQCQYNDWHTGGHKAECRRFANIDANLWKRLIRSSCGQAVRLVARAVVKKDSVSSCGGFCIDKLRTFEDLLYRAEFGERCSSLEEAWDLYCQVYTSNQQAPKSPLLINKNVFTLYYGKIGVNSHSIVSYTIAKSHTLGQAVYLQCSQWDHSCEPDMEYCFDGAILRAHPLPISSTASAISDKKPAVSQLTIPYCYLEAMPTNQRRMALQHSYNFQCRCTKCLDIDGDRLSVNCIDYECRSCNQPLVYLPECTGDKKGAIRCLRCNSYADIGELTMKELEDFWHCYSTSTGYSDFITAFPFRERHLRLPLHQVRNTTLSSLRATALRKAQLELSTNKELTPEQSSLTKAFILELCRCLVDTYGYYDVYSPNYAKMLLQLATSAISNGDTEESISNLVKMSKRIWTSLMGNNCPLLDQIDNVIIDRKRVNE